MRSEEILAGLTSIANDWRWLATTWHIVLASVLVFALGVGLDGMLLVASAVLMTVTAFAHSQP